MENNSKCSAVYYQLSLLTEDEGASKNLLQKAIHLNPSVKIYWKELMKGQNKSQKEEKQTAKQNDEPLMNKSMKSEQPKQQLDSKSKPETKNPQKPPKQKAVAKK